MKKKKSRSIIAMFLVALLSMQCVSFAYYEDPDESMGNPDMSDWYVWDMPDDKAAFGTAIDASFLLDKPAGKHGFAKAEGENFVFEDGTEIKVWGTTLAYDACFPTKETAELLADRIARSGYNLVRFHHLTSDGTIWGRDSGASTMQKIDKERLDRLFYLISLLKERGVYVYMDLIGNRYKWYKEDYPQLQNDPKGAITCVPSGEYLDERIKELMKAYLAELLTTVNPYTGLSLADDPVMLMCQIQNESGTLYLCDENGDWNNSAYTLYKRAWINWLKEKYGTDENLREAWKETGAIGLKEHESLELGTVDFHDDYRDTIKLLAKAGLSRQRRVDIMQFLYELHESYYEEYRLFLKEDLKVKCLITSIGWGASQGSVSVSAFETNAKEFDFSDNHVYKSHPTGWGWDAGTAITGWTQPTLVGGGEMFRWHPYNRISGQPYIVGEWGSCPPSPYAAESQLVHAIVSEYQGWNGLVNFCLWGDKPVLQDVEEMNSVFFQTFYVPCVTSILPATAAVYLRGDIEQAEEYCTVYSHDDLLEDEMYKTVGMSFESMFVYHRAGTAFSDIERGKDYESTPDVMEKAVEKHMTNERQNDQLYWNRRMGIMTLDTEYSNVATGYIGDKKIELDFADIQSKKYSCTITLTSATKDKLKDSDSILLTTVSKGRNTDMKFDDETGSTILNTGKAPILLEPIEADITIKTTDDVKVYALDGSGNRKTEVPVSKLDNGYSSFTVDGRIYETPHYEIVK